MDGSPSKSMEQKNYFREHEEDSVKGFTVIESTESRVRLAEKWNSPDRGSRWLAYWVSRDKLAERIERDLCEKAGSLSDEQFEQVCELTDARALGESQKVEA